MVIFNQNYFCSIPLQNLLFATYIVYYVALFAPYALEKGFTDFLQIFPNFFGISKFTSLSPSTSMKYEDKMNVV
jgi:hypothetical protein